MDRLGFGFESLAARRAGLIYASLSGFGQTGPWSDRPAYDHILQGISGLMAMTGDPQSGPMRVGLPIADYIAGQALVAAVLGALLQRAHEPTRAQRLSISMLDALTTFMGAYAIHHETTGKLRGLEGNRAFADTPFSGRFATADGYLVVTANTPSQAARLCHALGRPDLLDEPDPAKVAQILQTVFGARSAQEWEDVLSAANIPAARVRSLAEALSAPQMAQSPAWLPLDVPQLGMTVRAPALPFDAPWRPSRLGSVPVLGEHGASLRAELQEKV
jgi:crotonobetainyl-CoA:carnitine CoA-transferase CaiB-like acyl-CoA transferase